MFCSDNREKNDFSTRSVLKEGSGTVLGLLLKEFERVLDGFQGDLGEDF